MTLKSTYEYWLKDKLLFFWSAPESNPYLNDFMFPHFPPSDRCKWCGNVSMINRPTTPCLRCINANNAKLIGSTLPFRQIGCVTKFTVDVMHTIACFFTPWHNAHALYCRQYLYLLLVIPFAHLSEGPETERRYLNYVPDLQDPLDLILDMLYDDPGPDVTTAELAAMPTPP